MLRVKHFNFTVNVDSIAEGLKIMQVLKDYDAYNNMASTNPTLEVQNSNGEWEEWKDNANFIKRWHKIKLGNTPVEKEILWCYDGTPECKASIMYMTDCTEEEYDTAVKNLKDRGLI